MAGGWRSNYLRYRSFFLNIYNVYKRRPDLKMFMEILLSLGTISFFAAFALRPTALTIVDLLEQIDEKETTIEKMDQKIQNLQTAQTLYVQETARISLLDSAVPEQPSPHGLVRQVEGLANTQGVRILGISVGEVLLVGTEDRPKRTTSEVQAFPQGSGELSFSASVTADYASLDAFFSGLENLRFPVKIDNASINASETDEGRTLVLVVSGRVPYLKEVEK